MGRSVGGMFSLTSRQLTETSTYAQTILSTLKEERERTGKNKKWNINELRDEVFKVLDVKNNNNNRNGEFTYFHWHTFSVSHCQSTEDTAEYAKLILSQLATISMRLILLELAYSWHE